MGVRHKLLGKGLKHWAEKYLLPANRLKDLKKEIGEVQVVHPALRDTVREIHLKEEYEKAHEQLEIF
jgi:hypothetical protein